MPEALSRATPKGYGNTVSSIAFLRALALRLIHLRSSCADLHALAEAGERILAADAALSRPKLSAYTIRGSIVVMACAMIEGVLLDLAAATKEAEGLTVALDGLRGSSLEKANAFFKEIAQLRFPDQTQTWRELKALFHLRHAIVHNWGRARDDRQASSIASLRGITTDGTGEVWIEMTGVEETLRIMEAFSDELEAHLGGPQDP